MKRKKVRRVAGLVLSAAAYLLICGVTAAQNNEEKGAINGRSGATMTIQTQDSGNVTVLLTPDTQVLESYRT